LLDQICTGWTKEPTLCTAKVRFDKGRVSVFEKRHVRRRGAHAEGIEADRGLPFWRGQPGESIQAKAPLQS